MHELSITQNILEIALDYGRRSQASRILEIHLQIGEISGLVPECLHQCFEIVSEGTIAAGAKLCIERIPARMRCQRCAIPFPVDPSVWETRCPSCGSKETGLISGRELKIDSLEVQ